MKVGVGIIGAGRWGETHSKAFSSDPRARLIAICDKNLERAQQLAEKYEVEKWYADYSEMLEDPEISAVSIAVPDFAHKDPAVCAAKNGKHVLVEKPMATSVEDAEAMVNASKEAEKILMVDFHNRWNPPFVHVYNAVKEGEIGTPSLMYIRHSNTFYVPLQMLSWSGKSSVAWFLGSHSIDLARWLFQDEAKKVYSVSRSNILKDLNKTTPDFFASIIEFKKGGVAIIENSWILPDSLPSVGDFKFELIGSKGATYVDFTGSKCVSKYAKKASFPDILEAPVIYGKVSGFAIASIRHFVDCIYEEKTPIVTGEDGLANTRIICAIYESMKKGEPVYLSKE